MPDLAPKPTQTASRKYACIHCGYDLRDTPTDARCPECGNAASDTREGTLFYRLPPTRLGVVVAGGALVSAMHATCLVFSIYYLAHLVMPGGIPDAVQPLWDAVAKGSEIAYAPWIAIFVLASPLYRFATWGSQMRVTVIVLAAALVLFETGIDHYLRTSQATGAAPGPSGGQVARYLVSSVFAQLPALLSCIQLHKIARRLPGSPFGSIGPLSIICAILLLVRAGVEGSGVLYQSSLSQSGLAAVAVLLWVPPVIFPFVVYRELRAIARDVDADHPYTRI